MEKINIYVPENIGKILENDASMFEVYKADRQTINKNRFLSMLINGYYQGYNNEIKIAYEKIASILSNKNIHGSEQGDIVEEILHEIVLPVVPLRKGKNPVRLSLKPTKTTEIVIDQILSEIGAYDYISQYFCRMLISYCNKPFYIRERIIFSEAYELLEKACKNRSRLVFKTIWNKNQIHEVIAYRVMIGFEEQFNYLLCAEINQNTGEQVPKVFRLCRLDKIIYGKTNGTIEDSVQEHLNQMIQYGPQYVINDDDETCVKMTESGRKNFNRIYYGRPIVEQIDKRDGAYYYYFKGSKDQIFLYFRRFLGEEAEIVSPLWLRDKMVRFHQKALDGYLNDKENFNG